MNVSSCFIQSSLCIYPRHKESNSKIAAIILPVVIVAIYRNLEIKKLIKKSSRLNLSVTLIPYDNILVSNFMHFIEKVKVFLQCSKATTWAGHL